MRAAGSIAVALLVEAASVAAVPLAPAKPWVVDYADTYCAASREYREAGAPVQLTLRPSPNGKILQLFVIRSAPHAAPDYASLTVTLAGPPISTRALIYSSKEGNHRYVVANLGPTAVEEAARTRAVAVKGGDGLDEVFVVPDMAKVMAALATCNADLQAQWHASAATAAAAIKRQAKPVFSLGHYLRTDDFPEHVIAEGQGGQSRVMLLIDEQGKVRDCLISESSGDAYLDATTCVALVERARFHPALDANGKPIKSSLEERVVWRIAD